MLQDAAKVTKRNLVVASTRHHHSRFLKYYPRPPCAPGFVKSRIFRPLQTHFLLFQQIFFVLVCTHPGTPRVPPRAKTLRGQLEIVFTIAAPAFDILSIGCVLNTKIVYTTAEKLTLEAFY